MNAWERAWFTPASPVGLLAVRALAFTAVAVDVWIARGRFRRVAPSAETVWEPVSVLGLIDAGPPPAWLLDALVWSALLAACLAAVVPWSRGSQRVVRAAGLVAATSYAGLVLAANSLGKIDHDRQPLFVLALVVAVIAVPRLRDAPAWSYRWGVQAGRLALTLMLLAAAWSKLSAAGAAWVVGPNLRNILATEALIVRDPPLSELALWIAADPARWQAAALGALLGEALAIGALLTDRQPLRAVLAVAGAGTLAGITLLMGLVGFPIVALTLVLFRFEHLPGPGAPRVRAVVVLTVAVVGLAATLQLAGGSWLTAMPVVAAAAVAVAGWLVVTPAHDETTDAPLSAPQPVAGTSRTGHA